MPKISALPSASALAGTEEIPLVQSGATKRATPEQVKTYVLGDLSAFGLSLVDDADAAAARTTLGLGSIATEAAGDFAAASHSHSSADISDFAEAVEDKIGAKVIAGTGISISYNDTTGETTVTNTAPSGGTYTDENARDAIGAALVAGNGMSVTVDDAGDTITLKSVGVGVSSQTGTSYTAVLADANTYIQFSNASAITFTIPPNSSVAFPIGTVIEMEQAGAGALSVAAGSGVTINSRSADLTLAGQYAVAFVKKVATNTWTMNGDL